MATHTIEDISPTCRKFKITVPNDDVQKSWDKVVNEIQSTADVRGFRKGKAPLSLIKKAYAQDIIKKVYNSIVNDAYKTTAQESKLQILGDPKIDIESQLTENADFIFSATVDIFVPVEIKDYKGLSIHLPSKLSPAAETEEFEKVLKEDAEHTTTCTEHAEHEPMTEERKQKIKDEIKYYFDQLRSKEAFDKVVSSILEKNSVEVADSLVELMINQFIMNNEVVKNKKDPKKVDVKDSALRAQYRDQALKQVKGIVALTQIAQQENIVVPFSEVAKSAAHALSFNQMNFQQIRSNQAEILQEHKNELTIMKTVSFLLEHGNIIWE